MGQFMSSHGDVISHVNITSVRVTDGGLYKCQAENSAGQDSHSARLNVYGPPTIRPMGQLTAVAGQTLTVACPVGGHPIEEISWFMGDSPLPMSHRQKIDSSKGILQINEVSRPVDEGTYSCRAVGRQGISDTQHVELRVVGEVKSILYPNSIIHELFFSSVFAKKLNPLLHELLFRRF